MAPASIRGFHRPLQGEPSLAPPFVLPRPRDRLEAIPSKGADESRSFRPPLSPTSKAAFSSSLAADLSHRRR